MPMVGMVSNVVTMAPAHRIICHVDVDAMYVGCERELNPNALLHVPVGKLKVVQHNMYVWSEHVKK